jgi:hypothetical protein
MPSNYPGVWSGGDWSRESDYLKLADTTPMRPLEALLKQQLRDPLVSWSDSGGAKESGVDLKVLYCAVLVLYFAVRILYSYCTVLYS